MLRNNLNILTECVKINLTLLTKMRWSDFESQRTFKDLAQGQKPLRIALMPIMTCSYKKEPLSGERQEWPTWSRKTPSRRNPAQHETEFLLRRHSFCFKGIIWWHLTNEQPQSELRGIRPLVVKRNDPIWRKNQIIFLIYGGQSLQSAC